MQFIRLTNFDDSALYVNMEQIVAFSERPNGGSYLYEAGTDTPHYACEPYTVKESPDEIAERMREGLV